MMKFLGILFVLWSTTLLSSSVAEGFQASQGRKWPRGWYATRDLQEKTCFSGVTTSRANSPPPPQTSKRVSMFRQATVAATTPEEDDASSAAWSKINVGVFLAYLSNIIANTLPIMMIPYIAQERIISNGLQVPVGAIVASIASISTLGGGVGKVVNGVVVQKLGGTRSATVYLLGVSFCSFLLSTASTAYTGHILACMEFFGSVQWTACAVVLSNHFEKNPAKFAKGVTIVSLASTMGVVAVKLVGSAALRYISWRKVAQLGSLVALLGAFCARSLLTDFPEEEKSRKIVAAKPSGGIGAVFQPFKAVFGSPMFWLAGMAHATAFLARTSDRVMGAFFEDATSLPRAICGGLTASVTFGFVHGLISGKAFNEKDLESKTKFLTKKYSLAVASSLALAVCANKWFQSLIASNYIMAALVVLFSGSLTSNLAFQFYQIPPLVSTTVFKENRAVSLSLMDGLGFFLSAPVWAATGKIVSKAGVHGWSLVFVMLSALFGAGGATMLRVLPPVLQKQMDASAQ